MRTRWPTMRFRWSCSAPLTCGFSPGEEAAQGTLEYALTIMALMAILGALALLWRAGEDGTLSALVEQAASHGFEGTGILDIILY